MVLFYDQRPNRPDIEPYPLMPLRWPYLDVVEIAGKGRGVITTRDLPKGALIERAPVLIVPEYQRALADKTIVANYLFLWEHDRLAAAAKNGFGRGAIALGVTSLVNHSDHPNARIRCHIDAREIELRAIHDIDAGEEILTNYSVAPRLAAIADMPPQAA